MIPNAELRSRDFYLNRLTAFQDTEPVKIITGMRTLNNSNAFEYPPVDIARRAQSQITYPPNRPEGLMNACGYHGPDKVSGKRACILLQDCHSTLAKKQGILAERREPMKISVPSHIEQKRVTISSKRQFTIPQKFYSALGFDKDAICTMGDGMLIIQPVDQAPSGEFAEEILAELVNEGLSGQKLLEEFKIRQAKVKPSITAMLEAAKLAAQGIGEYSTYDDVFGSED